jgi:outer membrane protein, heavy metal efflux system
MLAMSLRSLPARPVDRDTAEAPLPSNLTLRGAVARFRSGGFDLLLADADVESSAGDLTAATAIANPSAETSLFHSFFPNGLFQTHNGWEVGLGDSNAIADALVGKRSADRIYELNEVRFERGAISEVDVAPTETAKLEAAQAVDSAIETLDQAKVALAFLVGQRRPSLGFDVDPAEIRFRTPAALADATPEALVEKARDARPDLLGERQQGVRAGAAAALARRDRFPDLALGVQYQQEGSATGPSASQAITPPTIALTLTGSIPLFYQQQGEIRRAQADLATQSALAAKTEAQVVSDVETAFAAYRAARALVTRMEGRLLDRARRARELTAVQYQKGAASLLEYLDAQRTYSTVSAEYWQDLAGYWNAVFQLEAATATELSS